LLDARDNELIGTWEVSHMLDLSERPVRRLATRLGGKKRGRVWLFDPEVIAEHIEGKSL
jgi:hypothetical protein